MSQGKKVLAFVISSLVISAVGLAILNRLSVKSPVLRKFLGAGA